MAELIKKEVIKLPPYEQGLENEARVLKAVRWFGHLRHADLAKQVWAASPLASALESARRTCKKLVAKELLVARKNTFGSKSFVLSAKGATMLTSQGLPSIAGTSIQGVSGPYFRHRTMTTQYLIARKKKENYINVFGENALQKGWFAKSRAEINQYYRKLPDALITTPGSYFGFTGKDDVLIDWIETESSFKSMTELEKVLSMGYLTGTFFCDLSHATLNRLVIVTDLEDRHEAAILRAFRRVLAKNPIPEDKVFEVMNSIIVVRANTGVEMQWKSYEEITLTELFKKHPQRKPRSSMVDGLG